MINYFDPNTTSKDMRITIADRIRQERKILGLSQEEFAKQIGYSKPTVGAWERKDGFNRIPDYDQLIDLCGAFHCEPDYLLCIIDTKSRMTADIQTETGLNEKAINVLRIETATAARDWETPLMKTQYDMFPITYKQYLINAFITGCDPIAHSLYEIHEDETMWQMYEKNGIALHFDLDDDLALFNRIYDSSAMDYKKISMFVDEAFAKHPYQELTEDERADLELCDDDIKELLYHEYQMFENRRIHNKTNYHRHNMTLTFNQIIDSLVTFEIE